MLTLLGAVEGDKVAAGCQSRAISRRKRTWSVCSPVGDELLPCDATVPKIGPEMYVKNHDAAFPEYLITLRRQ